jgi:hypothetical protein
MKGINIMIILWIEYEGTIVQVQILIEFGSQHNIQRGSAVKTLTMMEIDALAFKIRVSFFSSVLVEMVTERRLWRGDGGAPGLRP